MAEAIKKLFPIPLVPIIAGTTAAVIITIILAVVLTLPQSYTCRPADKGYYTVVVPKPQVQVTFTPAPVVCTLDAAQRASVVSVNASSAVFLFVDSTTPLLSFDNGNDSLPTVGGLVSNSSTCSSIKMRGHHAHECEQFSFVAPYFNQTDTFLSPEIEIAFPRDDDCDSVIAPAGSFYFVPPPKLLDVTPPVVCSGASGVRHPLVLKGLYFLSIGDQVPNVTINGALDDGLYNLADPLSQMGGCTQLAVNNSLVAIQVCSQMTIFVDPSASYINVGANEVNISNPAAAGCASATSVQFWVQPTPTFTALSQVQLCSVPTSAAYGSVVATGANILQIDGVSSSVSFNGVPATNPVASGCTNVSLPLNPHQVQVCSSVTFNVPSLDAQQRAIGTAYSPTASLIPPNPIMDVAIDSTGFGCANPKTSYVEVYPAPVIDVVSPNPQCIAAAGTVNTLFQSGPGIVSNPVISLNSVSVAPFLANCSGTTDIFGNVLQVCHEFNATTMPSAEPAGPSNMTIYSSPVSYGCLPTMSLTLEFSAPPQGTMASPDYFCSSNGGTLGITGTNFEGGTQFWLQRNCTGSTDPTCVTNSTYPAASISVVNSTYAMVSWNQNSVPGGQYILGISNGANCVDFSLAINVRALVLVFYANPPTVYNGIAQSISVLTTGLDHDTLSVTLYNDTTGFSQALSWSESDNINRLNAIIPSGLPVGYYGIQVRTTYGCAGALGGLLDLTSTLSIDITSVDPDYAWNDTTSYINVQANSNNDGFEPIPFVSLSPVNGSSGAIATPLTGVFLQDSFTMTAAITPGIPAGEYYLVIVNLNGSVGLTTVHIIEHDLPYITQVSPSFFVTSTGQVGQITGTGFSTDALYLNVTCLVAGSPMVMNAPSVSNLSPTSFTATFDFTNAGNGAACNIRVINSDGSNSLFVAVSTKSPSGNLAGFSTSPNPLVRARQGHALLSGSVTPALRFLYAIGGNNGSTDGPYTSVERTQMDRFGSLQTWSETPSDFLPTGISFIAGTSIGRFLYIAGGKDVNGTSQTQLYRAQVLNPADALPITVEANLNPAATLQAGLYFYSIAPQYPLSDAINPGGIGLPSEIASVRVPNISTPIFPAALEILISWNVDPRASSYLVYRSGPGPDAPLSSISLVANLSSSYTSVVDNGTLVNDLSQTPRTFGSLGAWNPITQLNVPRDGLALASAPVPGSNGLKSFIWAFLGYSHYANGTLKFPQSYEQAVVDLSTPANLFSSNFSVLSYPFAGRGGLGISHISYNDLNAVTPAGVDYFFLGPGETSPGVYGNNFELLNVTSASGLSINSALCGSSGSLCSTGAHDVGYCNVQAAGVQYFVGGGTPSPTVSAQSAAPLAWPTMVNFGPNGAAQLPLALSNVACIASSAHIFITGGVNSLGAAQSVAILSVQ